MAGLQKIEEINLKCLISAIEKIEERSTHPSKEALGIIEKIGFKETKRAISNLKAISSRVSGDKMLKLLRSVLGSPQPDRALNGIEQVMRGLSEEDCESLLNDDILLSYLAIITAASPYLTGTLLKNPDFFSHTFLQYRIQESKDLNCFLRELCDWTEGLEDFNDMARVLRLYKQREFLRIGARDLCGLAGFEEISGELSDLASACLETGLRFCLKELKERYGTPIECFPDGATKEAEFTIIGMGKLGGRELNFSSDIDILYLYSSDKGETSGVEVSGGTTGKVDLHTFYVKLSERITRLIGQTTEGGNVFRVDLDLRPEGKSGDLANSLRSMEIYYESWGQTWERSALIKARPVAGCKELGKAFLDMIGPFVYRRYLDFTAIDEIKGMKEKIDLQITRRKGGIDVKLGKGGIREIEFFIQALQLINGGKDTKIRERNTLRSIKSLIEGGYIKKEEGYTLQRAYIFLRTLEHRLQILYGRQTHSLPKERMELTCLAKGLHIEAPPGKTHDAALLNQVKGDMESVHRIYEGLFYKPTRSLLEGVPENLLAVLEGLLPEDEAIEVLSTYRFKDTHRALSALRLLKEGPPFAHYSSMARQCLKRIAPFLLSRIVAMPDPDMALSNIERFLSTVGARATYLSLLAENKDVMEIIIGLFGTSSFLSRFLIEHPELLDSFITEDITRGIKRKVEMERELDMLLEKAEGYEEVLNVLRRYRNTEILRIGVNDIQGRLRTEDVSSQISSLADLSLQRAFEIAREDLTSRYGEPRYEENGMYKMTPFCILGLGKLGGEELLYGSDLDVIFIYSHSGETSGRRKITNLEFFTRLAQKIISILTLVTSEGFLFKIDTRLRPSGSSGPIVTSLMSLERYYRERAAIWERQALLRARFSAGNPVFGKEVIALTGKLIFEKPLTVDDVKEINRLRGRMERELGRETEERIDIKFGMGGLVDIEFIVQLLQLRYGKEKPEIIGPNTSMALKGLRKEEILSDVDYKILSEAYSFYRRIEDSLRIVEDRAGSEIILTDKRLDRVFRGLSFDSLYNFLHGYRKRAIEVRSIYKKVFSMYSQ